MFVWDIHTPMSKGCVKLAPKLPAVCSLSNPRVQACGGNACTLDVMALADRVTGLRKMWGHLGNGSTTAAGLNQLAVQNGDAVNFLGSA